MKPERRDYRIYRDRAREGGVDASLRCYTCTHSFSRPRGHFGKRATSPLFLKRGSPARS